MMNPYYCELDDHGVIAVTGQDRLSFLNGQLTQDMNQFAQPNNGLAAYCNPKGRVIALLYLFSDDETVYLVMDHSLREKVLKRLQMFVLRADVRLEDISESKGVLGVSAPETEFGENRLTVPASRQRFLLLYQKSIAIDSFLAGAGCAEFEKVSTDQWKLQDIIEGQPRVSLSTSEQFVAQAMNLEALNAISFTKGCYVGQEIVARMHYLGKSRQQMLYAVLEIEDIQDGEALRTSDGEKLAEVLAVTRLRDKTEVQLCTTDPERVKSHPQVMELSDYSYQTADLDSSKME